MTESTAIDRLNRAISAMQSGPKERTFRCLCYMVGHANLSPYVVLKIAARDEHSARLRAYERGAQEIISVN